MLFSHTDCDRVDYVPSTMPGLGPQGGERPRDPAVPECAAWKGCPGGHTVGSQNPGMCMSQAGRWALKVFPGSGEAVHKLG